MPLAVEVRSLNRWTARKSLFSSIFVSHQIHGAHSSKHSVKHGKAEVCLFCLFVFVLKKNNSIAASGNQCDKFARPQVFQVRRLNQYGKRFLDL